jgi:hypothetical protein
MLERDEKIIDFEVYKYSIPNIINITALLVVLLITLILYVICLPFIWFTPTHRLFIYFECLIKELT